MFDSPWHWAVVILVGFILFFGWKQLPDMSRSLGRSLRILKTEIKGMSEDDKARDAAADQPASAERAEKTVVAPKALSAAPRVVPAATAAARPRPVPRPTQSAPAASPRPSSR